MKTITFLLLMTALVIAQKSASANSAEDEAVIKKPGEITFTSGIVIEGRVEKPQVLLIMSKEKTKLPELKLNASMIKFIEEPVHIDLNRGKE
ncbi:MAG: hypothetical protein JNL74_10115 [Fibrobacteres bacterium]|nr:hypothetical protein [Fibrobacterota bacterium]